MSDFTKQFDYPIWFKTLLLIPSLILFVSFFVFLYSTISNVFISPVADTLVSVVLIVPLIPMVILVQKRHGRVTIHKNYIESSSLGIFVDRVFLNQDCKVEESRFIVEFGPNLQALTVRDGSHRITIMSYIEGYNCIKQLVTRRMQDG